MQKTLIVFVVGVAIGGGVLYGLQYNKAGLSPQEAGQRAIGFINANIEEGVTASLITASSESGVYKIRLQIQEQEYESYITQDGKLLFSSGIRLVDESPEEPAAEENTSEEPSSGGDLDSFAQCLTDKGMKFYGSKYCGWCGKQKELFGESLQHVNYIECINPETDQWSQECQEKGITGVPTWEVNGEMNSGFKTLEQLAELSGCSYE